MPFLVPIITGTIKGMLTTFFTQKMVEELIFQLLRYAVSKSENTLDDKILRHLNKIVLSNSFLKVLFLPLSEEGSFLNISLGG